VSLLFQQLLLLEYILSIPLKPNSVAMKSKILAVLFSLVMNCYSSFSQSIPLSRIVDWSLAGLRTSVAEPSLFINVTAFGASGDGTTLNDAAVQNAISSASGSPAVIYFPAGTYLFNSSLNIPAGIIIRGDSTSTTLLKFDLSGAAIDLLKITGTTSTAEYDLLASSFKDDEYIIASAPSTISAGDYIKLYQDDSSLVISSWAIGSVAQIIEIQNVNGDTLFLDSPLRRDFLLSDHARIRELSVKKNVGLECFKIERIDATVGQSSNISMNYAANCWVRGVESNMTNFAHLAISNSTNIEISGCYFHHAFAYGGGGQGYGALLQFSSGEVLVENNIFKNLRHSMILQAGANGNVFAYNYSRDPYWNEGSLPSNSAGDIVLHGNYPFANLFEGNLCQNMIIDNSHDINGPYNTLFRNRAAGYGLIMNTSPATNDQNFVANEITNTAPFMGQYYLSGTGHYQYGNNVKGTITPAGTTGVSPDSYYYSSTPLFFGATAWPPFGAPQPYNTGTIPALQNYNAGFYTNCEQDSTITGLHSETINEIVIYPNPGNGIFYIPANKSGSDYLIQAYNCHGQMILNKVLASGSTQEFQLFEKGIYFISLQWSGGILNTKVVVH
jgi:hypothetical protein